jgi:hypothetical protein
MTTQASINAHAASNGEHVAMGTDMHELVGVHDDFRYYMVGKLIRQDRGGEEHGFRQTLACPCHPGAVAKVIGPSRYELSRYTAYCPVTSEAFARGDTMEALWSAVELGEGIAKR